jgi:hypothetical protein
MNATKHTLAPLTGEQAARAATVGWTVMLERWKGGVLVGGSWGRDERDARNRMARALRAKRSRARATGQEGGQS